MKNYWIFYGELFCLLLKREEGVLHSIVRGLFYEFQGCKFD